MTPDTIDGGTLSNASEAVRTTVQRQVMPAADMVFPEFTPVAGACGKVGGVEFTVTLLEHCVQEIERIEEQLKTIRIRLAYYQFEESKGLPHVWPPATGKDMDYDKTVPGECKNNS